MLIDVKHLGEGAHRVLREHLAGSNSGKGPDTGEPVRWRFSISILSTWRLSSEAKQLSHIGGQWVGRLIPESHAHMTPTCMLLDPLPDLLWVSWSLGGLTSGHLSFAAVPGHV